MENKRYIIIKEIIFNGQKQLVLMTDGMSQILEYEDKEEANKMVNILNGNTDSGWEYSIREI